MNCECNCSFIGAKLFKSAKNCGWQKRFELVTASRSSRAMAALTWTIVVLRTTAAGHVFGHAVVTAETGHRAANNLAACNEWSVFKQKCWENRGKFKGNISEMGKAQYTLRRVFGCLL